MKKQMKFSIRFTITGIIALALIINSVLIGTIVLENSEDIVSTETKNHLDDFVTSYSLSMDNILHNMESQFEMFGGGKDHGPEDKDHGNSANTEMLTSVMNSDQHIKSITLLDKTGKVKGSTDTTLVGTSLSDDEKVNAVLTSGEKQVYAEKTEEAVVVITMVLPHKNDSGVTGATVAKFDSLKFDEALDQAVLTGIPAPRVIFANEEGLVLAHTFNESIGTVTGNDVMKGALADVANGTVKDTAQQGTYIYEGDNVYVSYFTDKDSGWTLAVNVLEKQVLESVSRIKHIFIIVGMISTLVMGAIGFFAALYITRPMERIKLLLEKVASLDFRINREAKEYQVVLKRNDEIGEMGRSIDLMLEEIKKQLEKVNESSEQIAASTDSLNDVANNVTNHAGEASALTEEISASMEETTASTDMINQNIFSVKENVSDINNQVGEGTKLTSEIMKRADSLRNESIKSEENTKVLFEDVKQKADVALQQSKSVAKINELANAINEIASQTSLLALNASIEAARAGEAGKGFAVVASEISSLASQSSETVANITTIVSEVNEAVTNMSECLSITQSFVEETVINDYAGYIKVMDTYSNDAQEIHEMIKVIDKNTEQLTNNVEDISKSLGSINYVMNESANSVNDIAKRNVDIVDLSSQTYSMVQENVSHVDELKSVVNAFKL